MTISKIIVNISLAYFENKPEYNACIKYAYIISN